MGKRCTKCGETKDRSEFCRMRAASDGLQFWCKLCMRDPEGQRRRRAEQRAQVIAGYGGRCSCCGETEPAFLVLDHVNDDGADHRRTIGASRVWTWALRHGFPPGLQLLCANCNMAKSFNLGGCPHLQ